MARKKTPPQFPTKDGVDVNNRTEDEVFVLIEAAELLCQFNNRTLSLDQFRAKLLDIFADITAPELDGIKLTA